jgi:protein TonB
VEGDRTAAFHRRANPTAKPKPVTIEPAEKVHTQQPSASTRDPGAAVVFTVNPTNIRADGADIILPPMGGSTLSGDLPPLVKPPVDEFTPKRAQPMGRPGLWVTPNDYPGAELRAEHEGATGFELSIGADGKVQSCRVTVSSGFPALDTAACTNLRKRGKFAAATDATGTAVASTYSSTVHWTIPKD